MKMVFFFRTTNATIVRHQCFLLLKQITDHTAKKPKVDPKSIVEEI